MARASVATGDRAHADDTNSTVDDEIWLIGKPQCTEINTDFFELDC